MPPDLALAWTGTVQLHRVWTAPGQVRRCGELARRPGSSARAVGLACRAIRFRWSFPCHRVVSADGLGGFMGSEYALPIKQWLLKHEGVLWRLSLRA